MSEELTVTVRQEVQVLLNGLFAEASRGAEQVISFGEIPGAREFYEAVLKELHGVVENYVRGGEGAIGSAPEVDPFVKVGDWVKVLEGCASEKPGAVFKVERISSRDTNPYDGKPSFIAVGDEDGDGPGRNGVWARFLEVVEEPEQNIEVGDLVRLTGEDWDEILGGIFAIVAIDGDGDPIFYDQDGLSWYVQAGGYEAEIYKKASEL